MILARWRRAWLTPKRVLPVGEDQRVVEMQGQLMQFLMRLADDSGQPQAAQDVGSAASGAAAGSGRATGSSGVPRLLVAPSTVPGAGRGVFLAAGSTVQAGDILTLYPGLVYDQEAQLFREMAAASVADDEAFAPAPPPFTINNHYLLHLRSCLGRNLMVDGRPAGVSAARFAAAAAGCETPVNADWLALGECGDAAASCSGGGSGGNDGATACSGDGGGGSGGCQQAQQGPTDPLLLQAALGHLINHQPAGAANVTFDLCPLPASLPPTLLRFVPALNAGGADPGLRWVPFVRALVPLAGGTSPAASRELRVLEAVSPCASGSDHGSSAGGGSGSSSSSSSGSVTELFVDYGADPTTLGFHL